MSTATSLTFDVSGMDCGDCARSVERIVATLPGITTASVNFATATLTVDAAADPELVRAIGGAVERAGYSANLRTDGNQRAPEVAWWKNRRLALALPALVLWCMAFSAQHFLDQEPTAIALFTITMMLGGYPIFRAAWAAARARRIDMNVLMTISVIGACLIGEWSEGALVVVLFSLGTTLQGVAFDRTRRSIRSLLSTSPEEAIRVDGDVDVTVRTGTLRVGDLVRVRPGDRVPADGEVVSGSARVNQAAITGESVPALREAGDTVFAGTTSTSGALIVRVTSLSEDSTLAKIVRLVEEAQAHRAPSQVLIDRFASRYTPAVVVIAALVALAGWMFTSSESTWLYRALVLLVVACPCALVISTPVSIVSAIGAATRAGILVKGGAALEAFGQVRSIAFDKTGTLTIGKPQVTDVIALGERNEREILSLAASVEQHSEHPLARAIVARALHDNVPLIASSNFSTEPGVGVTATLEGQIVAVGNHRLALRSGDTDEQLNQIMQQHATAACSTVIVAVDNEPVGVIAIADRLRTNAAEVISELRGQGIEHIALLTGDQRNVARAIASEIDIDQIQAELMPEDKINAIQTMHPVAMIGDGVNDAPALAVADVGVAMGMGGTDLALETADLALMRDDLGALVRLRKLAMNTSTIIRQNIGISLITKGAALILGVLGFVHLWLAVLVDVGTSLIVTFNALRLARNIEQQSKPSPNAQHHLSEPDHAH